MIRDLDTPQVVIDHTRLAANIARMQARADALGIALRPHIKTHKCVEVAALQRAAGAIGITASKVDEAAVFIAAGFPSVTIAYPLVDRRKIGRALEVAAANGCTLGFIADGAEGVAALSAAAADAGQTVTVAVKIDVGLGRCGLTESDPGIVQLAAAICDDPQLAFGGLLSHAGHAYGAGSVEGVRRVAQEEQAILGRVRHRLERAGIAVPAVSVGATPTAVASDSFDGIDEMRPGNYVFMDMTQLRLGIATIDEVALTVEATVVSANRDHAIIDAGSKTLSSDLGPHGSGGGGYGRAWPTDRPLGDGPGLPVVRLSEEHGFVACDGGPAPAVGSRLRIVPNHSCPVANLVDSFTVVDSDGAVLEWPVAARGKLR